LARKVPLGGGVPLAGPQEELSGPSGYTPRGFASSPGREARQKKSSFITTNKQTNKQTSDSKVSQKLIDVTNISISTENQISKSVY